jgi:hypothetical protein
VPSIFRLRKKLIHAMSLDVDRSTNRAVVVGCAISATRNYLKFYTCEPAERLVVAGVQKPAQEQKLPRWEQRSRV